MTVKIASQESLNYVGKGNFKKFVFSHIYFFELRNTAHSCNSVEAAAATNRSGAAKGTRLRRGKVVVAVGEEGAGSSCCEHRLRRTGNWGTQSWRQRKALPGAGYRV